MEQRGRVSEEHCEGERGSHDDDDDDDLDLDLVSRIMSVYVF